MILTAPFENHEANKNLRCNWLIILHKTRIHMCIMINAASECHAKISTSKFKCLRLSRSMYVDKTTQLFFPFWFLSGTESCIIKFFQISFTPIIQSPRKVL